jgi:hypothetical protein
MVDFRHEKDRQVPMNYIGTCGEGKKRTVRRYIRGGEERTYRRMWNRAIANPGPKPVTT